MIRTRRLVADGGELEGGEEAMNAVVVGPEVFYIAGAWWVVAAVIIAIGWRRRNRVLLTVGALFVLGALLAALQFWFLVVRL